MPSPPAPTRLVLIRHGQSRATVDRVAGGALGCRGLTELGVAQAQALADRLVATGELGQVTALVSSTLPRARETADVLAPGLGLAAVEDAALCEMDPGDGDGLSWDEWGRRFGGFVLAAEPFRPLAPGGESVADFQVRVGRALTRVADEHAGGVVVVACHGGVIDVSLRLGLGFGWGVAPAVFNEVANTSITEWLSSPRPDGPRQWRLIRFNDVGHLDPRGRPWSGATAGQA